MNPDTGLPVYSGPVDHLRYGLGILHWHYLDPTSVLYYPFIHLILIIFFEIFHSFTLLNLLIHTNIYLPTYFLI